MMQKKLTILFAAFSLGSCCIKADSTTINITSTIHVQQDDAANVLQEAQNDVQMLAEKWSTARGVTEVETAVRCAECGGEKTTEETTVSEEQCTKCNCGKPKQRCSSCNKPKTCSSCSSCSSCCK